MMARPDFHRRPTVWRRLLDAARALDNHWIGDLIGAVSLFAMLWIALVAGWVLQ
jgi:hypothetical protein